MKKYLLLIVLLLTIPFIVKAESIEIKDLTFVEKTDTAEIIGEPTFKDNDLNINVRFKKMNDYIKYKMTIKNNTDKEYEINTSKELSKYVTMSFKALENEDNIIKADSSKTIYVIITYDKEVPLEDFSNGSIITTPVTQVMELTAKEDKIVAEIKNPNTKTIFSIATISLLSISIIALAFLKSHKKIVICLILTMTLSIPLFAYAIDKITIDVTSKIEIKHPSFYIDFSWPKKGKVEFLFEEGMTWEEFMNSDYLSDEYEWNIVNYLYVEHRTPNSTGIENISYEYLPDGQEGINVGGLKSYCGDRDSTWFNNNSVITDEEGYPTPDTLIIDGYIYGTTRGVAC